MSPAPHVFIIEDDRNFRDILENELRDEGMAVRSAEGLGRESDTHSLDGCDVLLLDLNLPDASGLDILRKVSSMSFPIEVVIMTGHGTVASAVEAMRLGAYDFIEKPFKIEELKAIIRKAHEKRLLRAENVSLKAQIRMQNESRRIVTASPIMDEVLANAAKLASSPLPVLIYGESGTGKELIARAIHEWGPSPEKAFIAINCGAIPSSMLESELFGHEKGAFTGAVQKKPGMLELANEGTLFLDEIAEMPMELQSKLLRAIEENSFFRLGGTREIKVSLKFLSATNRDLQADVAAGRFRADLYYRIGALSLRIPPLRERPLDIPVLVEHFRQMDPAHKHKAFSGGAIDALCRYGWPGNIRELKNVVQRTLLLSPGDVVNRDDLPADILGGANEESEGLKLSDVEKTHIIKVLRESGGHRGRAAIALGIDPKTLYRKIIQYGIKM
ncbi:MAG: sigma-54 dependent transcriptional regulator [Nitrospiraceae bacterium]|nr:sigma-54 dependent transcriptional regulator [Nitrospiraceae bacterium]